MYLHVSFIVSLPVGKSDQAVFTISLKYIAYHVCIYLKFYLRTNYRQIYSKTHKLLQL